VSEPGPEARPEGLVKPQRGASELAARVISSLALAGLALTSAWYGGIILIVVWSVAAITVLREWFGLIGVPRNALTAFWIFGSASLILSAFSDQLFGFESYSMIIPAAVGAVLLGIFARFRGVSAIWTSVGPLYAAVVVLAPLWLREREPDGLVALLWLFLVVWISDIGAFFTGRRIGGPKLWPAVSPKKTWSGLLGGLFFGTLLASGFVLLDRMVVGPVFVGGAALFALTLSTSLVSELGDLFESAMKRHFGAKDSGHIIPGHGGLMDRLDSFVSAGLFAVIMLDLFGF